MALSHEIKRIVKTGSPEYARIHYWLRRNFGMPAICENQQCEKKSELYEWALKRGYEHAKVRQNYIRLCHTCHIRYDMTDSWRSNIGVASSKSWTKERKERRSKELLGVHWPRKQREKVSLSLRVNSERFLVNGENLSLLEIEAKYGINYPLLYLRIVRKGLDPSEAVNMPIRSGGYNTQHAI